MSSNTRWTCSTTSPGTRRSGQRRSVPSARRSRSTPGPAFRAPSTARFATCRPRPCSACKPVTTTSMSASATRSSASSCRISWSTTSAREMPESTPRTRCTGPTGCAPPPAGAAIFRGVGGFHPAAGELGKDPDGDRQPEIHRVFGPFYKTELFVGAGMGYHSNDARGTVDHAKSRAIRRRRRVRRHCWCARAAREVGVRTKVVPGLDSSVSAFLPAPGFGAVLRRRYRHHRGRACRASAPASSSPTIIARPPGSTSTPIWRSRGPGFSASMRLKNALYQSLAGFPQAQIGNAPGNFVYNAPWMVASAGITLGEKTGWFSALRWRYISSRPLTEDGVFQSPPLNDINGAVGYPVRQRLAHPARRAQSAELDDRPGDLRLWRAAHQRQPVRHVLSATAPRPCRRRSARTA